MNNLEIYNNIKIAEHKIVLAKELRNKERMKEIPNMPGFYKWWANKETLEKLLNSKFFIGNQHHFLSELFPDLEEREIEGKSEKYYYIYVGIAVKEAIRKRLRWHIMQHHTESSVKSGFLSTLRKSISSLVAGSQYAEEETNKLIDELYVEYYLLDLKIKSQEAKEIIEKIEKEELSNPKRVIPINIKDNKNDKVKEYTAALIDVRKRSKNKEKE